MLYRFKKNNNFPLPQQLDLSACALSSAEANKKLKSVD